MFVYVPVCVCTSMTASVCMCVCECQCVSLSEGVFAGEGDSAESTGSAVNARWQEGHERPSHFKHANEIRATG